jgi:hypothetical protein
MEVADSEWTPATLKEHIDAVLEERDKAVVVVRELANQRINDLIARVDAMKDSSSEDKDSINQHVTDLTLAITTKVSQEGFDSTIGEFRKNQEALMLLMQKRVTQDAFDDYQRRVAAADEEYRNREADARTQANRNTVGIIVAVLIALFSGIITLVANSGHL